MQGGYSMNLSAINNFVKNTHFLAKLRAAMKKKLKIQTSSQNKERMLSGKRLCELTIVLMAQQLERYLNPFDKEPARNFKTEEVIEKNIIVLSSFSILRENLLLEFITKHLLPSEERVISFLP